MSDVVDRDIEALVVGGAHDGRWVCAGARQRLLSLQHVERETAMAGTWHTTLLVHTTHHERHDFHCHDAAMIYIFAPSGISAHDIMRALIQRYGVPR